MGSRHAAREASCETADCLAPISTTADPRTMAREPLRWGVAAVALADRDSMLIVPAIVCTSHARTVPAPCPAAGSTRGAAMDAATSATFGDARRERLCADATAISRNAAPGRMAEPRTMWSDRKPSPERFMRSENRSSGCLPCKHSVECGCLKTLESVRATKGDDSDEVSGKPQMVLPCLQSAAAGVRPQGPAHGTACCGARGHPPRSLLDSQAGGARGSRAR